MPERLAPTVILAGTLGLREGECLALMRRDVDLRRMILHVRHSVSMERDPHGRWRPVIGEPKTGSSVRDIRIPDTFRPWLERALRNAQPGANGLLFPARDGGPMRPQTLRNLFAKARDRVPGLEGMWFHDLRKTALTALDGEARRRVTLLMDEPARSETVRLLLGRRHERTVRVPRPARPVFDGEDDWT